MKTNKLYDYSKTPQAKYDRVNTIFIGLRLEKGVDSDIIDILNDKPKQTEIKKLVRLGLERAKQC